ncbi:MAG: helix-turn-helix transcriptional regulator [Clostridiaceae bacterium]|nr:helix-turn-helix transcriptional regulator [Clostridiaceae bacterium]NBI84080.1 XRE family transcriptional regulator [Clostridiaceae bacterium]
MCEFSRYYRRLRDMREDHDFTQAQIAEILGTVQVQYFKYEQGIQEIPLHHIITLAKLYNISIDYLVGLIDDPKPLFPK